MANKYVAYCGLYCKLCDVVARIQPQSRELLRTMKRGGWEDFGDVLYPEFSRFWKVLKELSRMDETRGSCLKGCGDPSCEIRVCARKKGISVCSSCDEYPCEFINELAEKYPVILEYGKEQREIGLDAWIEKQERLFQSGFAYGDIISGQAKDSE